MESSDETNSANGQLMYCNFCSNEFIKRENAPFVCPVCHHGFVEEVNTQNRQRAASPEYSPDDPPNDQASFLSRLHRQQSLLNSHLDHIAYVSESIDTFSRRLTEALNPTAMTEAQLQEIPIVTITEEQTQIQCAVCFENFKLNENEVRQLQCTHLFHEKCVFPWVKSNGTCPVCRALSPNAKTGHRISFDFIGESIMELETLVHNMVNASTSPRRTEREEPQRHAPLRVNIASQAPSTSFPSTNTNLSMTPKSTAQRPIASVPERNKATSTASTIAHHSRATASTSTHHSRGHNASILEALIRPRVLEGNRSSYRAAEKLYVSRATQTSDATAVPSSESRPKFSQNLSSPPEVESVRDFIETSDSSDGDDDPRQKRARMSDSDSSS